MSLLVKTFNSRGLFKCRFVFSNLCSYCSDFNALGDCYFSAFRRNIKNMHTNIYESFVLHFENISHEGTNSS